MHAAEGILTTRGGMTSHAAVVARGMGKPCVSGAGAIRVDYAAGTMTAGGQVLKKGDIITIDGGTGEVLLGLAPMIEPELSGEFATLMAWADARRTLKVRTNAETPADARTARAFGAEGIGLCRTEHMFFNEDRILAVREMILADDEAGRQRRARQAAADAARRLRRAVRDHEGPAGHHPPARPAAARVPAARRRRRSRRWPSRSAPTRKKLDARANELQGVQPDAGPPRLPPRGGLSRDLRDAGARHLRGGGDRRQEDRPAGGAGGHGAAGLHQGRARPGQEPHHRDGQAGRAGDRHQARLPDRHHDRAAARGAARRRHRRQRRVLLVRHQRPDPDHLRHLARRRGAVPRQLHRRRTSSRAIPSCRSTRTASAS